MFGFLFKVAVVAAVVVGVLSFASKKQSVDVPQSLAALGSLKEKIEIPADLLKSGQNIDPGSVGRQISEGLDALVTHPQRSSPVVLGVKVTDESLGTLTDVLMNLPSEQLNQIRSAVCSTSSATQ